MFTHYRTQGFILKKTDIGESDRLFTIYTKDFGRLELLARAERKINSKLRSGLEIFYLSEIEFIQGKAYKTLTDAVLIDNFKNLRNDLKKMQVAFKVSDVFDKLIKAQEQDDSVWQLLIEIFNKLEQQSEKEDIKLVYYYFLWRMLFLSGYGIDLYNCCQCQKKLIPETLYFDPKEGGIICQNCFKKVKLDKKVDIETIKILRFFFGKNRENIFKLKIEKSYLKNLSEISDYYFSEILKQIE